MSTFYYVPQYFTTQLSVAGGIDDTQTTGIVLQSISGVDETKPGIIAVTWSNPIDTTKVEYITYTSINATTKELQGVTRGEEGYSAKSHVNGATVAWPLSKSHINNIPDSTTTFSNKLFLDIGVIVQTRLSKFLYIRLDQFPMLFVYFSNYQQLYYLDQ